MRLICCFYLFLLQFSFVLLAENSAEISNDIDSRNKFIPLPMGMVQPEGWLREEGISAISENGLSADIKQLSNNVWLTGSEIKNGGACGWWPYEQQAYLLDGVTRTAFMMHNEKLLNLVGKTYDAVVKRSENNPAGYFFCKGGGYLEDWQAGTDNGDDNKRWFETGYEGMYWATAVFTRGLIAEYMSTKDKKYLIPLMAYFRHYYNKGRDKNRVGSVITGYELYENRGLASLGPMVECIRLTGDESLYKRAIEIFKNNEDGMLRNYLESNYTTVCHGVTLNELIKLYAIGYILTGEKNYLKASLNAYNFVRNNHIQPHGVHSAQEFLLGRDSLLGTETCDIADYIWSSLWMLRATGNAKFADIIERVFYNAAHIAVTPDYTKHVYFQSPNQIPSMSRGGMDKMFAYATKHSPICCTRNLTRILPNFIGHAVMRTSEGVGVIFYIPSKTTLRINGKPVTIYVETDYPFNGNSKITFRNEKQVVFSLKLRIPEWCLKPRITVNGTLFNVEKAPNGFITLDKTWGKGDVIKINFPMTPKIVKGYEWRLIDDKGKPALFHGHGKQVDLKRFKRGAPYAYVVRGPLTFALPLKSGDDANIALLLNGKLKINVSKPPYKWSWDGKHIPVSIDVEAQKEVWVTDENRRMPSLPLTTYKYDIAKRCIVKLVPYGWSGKYRLTMFPVVE